MRTEGKPTTKKSLLRAGTIEEEITRQMAASGIRLRFDKVALRLLDEVKAAVSQTLPVGQSIAFTVTAPIRLPAKTSVALQEWLRRPSIQGLSTTIYGNKVRARLLNNTGSNVPKVIGFVHNPESDADLALDIAETSLGDRP